MTLTLRQQDEINAMIDAHVAQREIKPEPHFKIKWRGKFIKTAAGKFAWRKSGAAKLAFRNHLYRQYDMGHQYYEIVHGQPPIQQDWWRSRDEFVEYILKESKDWEVVEIKP